VNQTEIEIPTDKSPMKSQNPNPKFQIISNHQMTKIRNNPVLVILNWNLDIIWSLVLGDWCFSVGAYSLCKAREILLPFRAVCHP
jgi:hypothetical protein